MSDGFDPKAYLKEGTTPETGGFDPKAYAAEGNHDIQVADTSGHARAALDHFANAVAMGYLPHLQAAVAKLMPDPNAGVDAKLRAQGFKIRDQAPGSDYVSDRDEGIARLKKESEEHPISSAAGTVGGLVGGGIAMSPLAGARAANVAGRIAQGAKTGAAMAAAANPGDTEGELNPIQLGERLNNAKTGALFGGGAAAAVEAAPYVSKALGYAGKKTLSALSGVPQAEIDNYAARTNQINEMIEKSGKDLSTAADQVRQKTQDSIRATRQKLSNQISTALKGAPTEPVHEVSPIIGELNAAKARLNSNLQSDAVEQIDGMIQKLTAEGASADGKVSPQQLNQITRFLQDKAKSAYMQGGQIFQSSKEAAQAAKAAAAVSRKALNAAVPEVAQANNQLSMLHSIEDNLNKNLIAPGKSDSALFAAGAGTNPRNAKMLERLGSVTGTQPLQEATDLATMRTFNKPSLLPADSTGKAAARMMLAAGAGHALGGPAGFMMAAAASPAAAKLAINAANVFRNTPSLVNFAKNNPAMLQRITTALASPERNSDSSIQFDNQTLGIFKANPDLIDSLADPNTRRMLRKKLGIPQTAEKKPDGKPHAELSGEAKWMASGASKLGLSGELVERLKEDPKGKQLLIQASDLMPDTVAMRRVKDQIQKGFGKS